MKKNLDKVDWCNLSLNDNAIEILENNKDKINWYYLSLNPNAINLIKNNLDKIDWNILSMNPNAIDILENNKYDELNYFDPSYPFGGNEVEWFDRFKKKGGIPIVVPRTFIYHYKLKS